MSPLPTGTVTFLFTDIEGSTRLWEQYPEQMNRAHARHTELIVGSVEAHGGTFVRDRGEGDSTFSTFIVAGDAVAAACAFQRALAAETWPPETPIRVRAALHTGTAILRDGDYNSTDVNRCARLRAIAYGGQTLVSQSVYVLAHASLLPDITLTYLGRYELKDLQEGEHVYQLCHPDLQQDFPPLKAPNVRPNNLPRQLSRFIGRVHERKEVSELVRQEPMLTLTGVGGCGKTRLALQVALDLLDHFRDGVWLVELAGLSDASLLPQQVASVMAIREEATRSIAQTLIGGLKTRQTLLVLDNCEHLLDGCARLADSLLQACPDLTILATSREALSIAGERVWQVPPLSQPDRAYRTGARQSGAAKLMEYDAVQLFVERARAQRPAFAITPENAQVVAHLCDRLDGIPLAIELATARLRAMSVEQLAARLEDSFRLLVGKNRNALPRHQTLDALIDWSYNLLTEPERTLFERLSVFMGGWTLEAAEQVCGSDEGVESREWGVEKAPQAPQLLPTPYSLPMFSTC